MTLLRAARSTDAGAVAAILGGFVDETAWLPRIHSRAEDVAHAGEMISRGWVTVAETHSAVQGFAACNGAELNALYVAKGARGQGIGTALLAGLMAHRDTLELWTFEANGPARKFYAKHGFTEQTRTNGADNDEGLPDVKLRWCKEAL